MLALGIGVLWSFRESMFKARLWSWKSNQNQFSPGVFILIAYLREFWSFSAFPERICDENSQKSICTRFLQFVLLSNVQIHSHSLSQSISSEFELRLAEAGSFGNGENSAAVCSISEWGRNNEIISTPINPNLTDAAWNATEGKSKTKPGSKTILRKKKEKKKTRGSYIGLYYSSIELCFKYTNIDFWAVLTLSNHRWVVVWLWRAHPRASPTISIQQAPPPRFTFVPFPFPSHWRCRGL